MPKSSALAMAASVGVLPATWSPQLLSLLRVMVALLFLQHGTAKLLGFPPLDYFGDLQLFSLLGISGILELIGGALLALGLFTRLVAFILSGMMAVAYFLAHADQSFFPLVNQGELAVLYCFVFLYFAAAGAGPWSLDALLRQSSGRTTSDATLA